MGVGGVRDWGMGHRGMRRPKKKTNARRKKRRCPGSDVAPRRNTRQRRRGYWRGEGRKGGEDE